MKLRINLNGTDYEVDVEVLEDDRAPATGGYAYYSPRATASALAMPAVPKPQTAAAPVAEEKVCRSPIAGVIVRVNTHVGQHVQVNDPLMVLEAMKMETAITSPVVGTVKAVNGDVGDGVQVGQVLVEFE